MPKKEMRSPGTPASARRRTGPPQWALAAIAGIVGTFTLTVSILSELDVSLWIRLPKPFDDNSGLTIVLFIAMCVAVMVVIVASKVWEAGRAAAWPQADGRVVKSATEARRHQFSGEATTVTNVPAVEYEFAVAGTTYRGARISIGEDSGGANTEATLARHPVGATVMVYYDPADPTDCVLERDIPRGMGRGCALFAAIGAAALAGIYWLATSGKDFVAAHLPEGGNAPLVVLTSAMGLAASAFFFAARRISEEAARWPVTRRKVGGPSGLPNAMSARSRDPPAWEVIPDGRPQKQAPAIAFGRAETILNLMQSSIGRSAVLSRIKCGDTLSVVAAFPNRWLGSCIQRSARRVAGRGRGSVPRRLAAIKTERVR